MYIYENHLGGIYTSEDEYDLDSLYCEQCGDTDWLIGEFGCAVDALTSMADDIDVDDGHGGYNIKHVLQIFACFDDCPTYEEAIKIIKSNRSIEL